MMMGLDDIVTPGVHMTFAAMLILHGQGIVTHRRARYNYGVDVMN